MALDDDEAQTSHKTEPTTIAGNCHESRKFIERGVAAMTFSVSGIATGGGEMCFGGADTEIFDLHFGQGIVLPIAVCLAFSLALQAKHWMEIRCKCVSLLSWLDV